MKIFLKTEVCNNLSHHGIAVYCGLRFSLCDRSYPVFCTSLDNIAYALTDDISYPTRFKEALLIGFNELVSNGYLKVIKKKKDTYIVDYTGLLVDPSSDPYVIVDPEELKGIFKIENVKVFQLLKYFVYLASTMTLLFGRNESNGTGVYVSNYAATYLSKISDISYQTVLSYNKALEDAHLLYVYRKRVYSCDSKGNPYFTPNIYGRYKDKEIIDKVAPAYLKKKKLGDIYE